MFRTNKNNSSYVNGHFGKIHIKVQDDGVVLLQEKNGKMLGAIGLTPDDMEKLGKALFAVKKSNFPSSSVSTPKPPVSSVQKATPASTTSTGTCHMKEQKAKYVNAYNPWTPDEEARLKKYHYEGKDTTEIAKLLGRNEGGVISRKAKLGLQ